MQRLPGISNPPHPRTVYWTVLVAIVGLLLLAGLTLNPLASSWVSEAAQSEFASSKPAEPAAIQMVQPARPITTVRAE